MPSKVQQNRRGDGLVSVSGLELAKLMASLMGELTLLQSLPHYENCHDDCLIDTEMETRITTLERLIAAAGFRATVWRGDEPVNE